MTASDWVRKMLERLRADWPLWLVGGGAAVLYAVTLQTTIGSCNHGYCADSGEFQIALAVWGTAHHTGYPLYLLLGSPFVNLLWQLGIAPAAGSSLYSLFWEVVAVVGVGVILGRATHRLSLAFGGAALFAVLQPIWVHGAITEVYSLSMALAVAMVGLTLELYENWSDTKGWGLVLLAGLGVAHHRLLGLLLPPIGVYLIITAYRHSPQFGRWLGLAILMFLLGFVPYLDMPLRVWFGSTWNYGQPATWDGFWYIFFGHEVRGLQQPNWALTAIGSAWNDTLQILRSEFTMGGLVVIGIATVTAIVFRKTRASALFLLSVTLINIAFILVLREAVLIEATIMIPLMLLVLLLGIGLSHLPEQWSRLAAAALFFGAIGLGVRNYPQIVAWTKDVGSVLYIRRFEQLEAPPGAIVMSEWGQGFFALKYAQKIEGRLTQWNIVDHRANFTELAGKGTVYTAQETLFWSGVTEWEQQLGKPLRISSAGPQLIALSGQPLPHTTQGIPIGDGIQLVNWEVRPAQNQWQIVLYWTATEPPLTSYSTYVHATDQPDIASPDDLVAQSDAAAPVYSWYPTTQWIPNETVREDHVLTVPADRPIRAIIIGMYTQNPSGEFVHLKRVLLHLEGTTWMQVTP